ncbi:MAG: hypothetical protein AAF502_07415, partial [Bacteroidota bacterium]
MATSSLALLLQEKGTDCSTLVFTIPFCWLFSFGRNGLDFLLLRLTFPTILPREKSTALRPPPGGEGNWLLDIG